MQFEKQQVDMWKEELQIGVRILRRFAQFANSRFAIYLSQPGFYFHSEKTFLWWEH